MTLKVIIFQENDTIIRKLMLIHSNKSIIDFFKKEKKEEFINNIQNIDLQIYEN